MIGLGSTFIIMACSIYLIVEGNEKNDSTKFYGGIIVTILSISLMCLVIQNIKNTENMGKIYKFKRLNEMKLDDYGFGLFEYNGALYFKEAEGERCFDVRSGNEGDERNILLHIGVLSPFNDDPVIIIKQKGV